MKYTFDNERPIYVQLVEIIRVDIVSGQYQKGDKLPSVRELALMMKVNPNTMQKALIELENEKLVYTERTNGKFVTTNKELIDKIKKELAEEKIINFLNDMENIGITHNDAIRYLQELGGNK